MIQGEQDDNDIDPRMELRANRGDKLHDLQLLRDLAIINARTVQELGPLPPDGLPVQPRRKPDLPRPPESLAVEEDDMNPLQRIAATTALAASTLAACGDATSPEQSAEAASAPAAPIPASAPSAPNPPPVTAPEPVTEIEIKRGPAIPAATLRKQILALLDSLQSLETLEHEHVESIFRVHLTKDPEVRDGYEYFGITTEGWTYRIAVSRLYTLSDPPTIMIYVHKSYEPNADPGPTYCTFDFEELARDIVALGYERDATRSVYGNKPSWGFGKRVPTQRTGFSMSVYLYYLDEWTESERACVQGFNIDGGPRHE